MTTQENNNPEAVNPVEQNLRTDVNPATQTLFRFVSLRNPQLTETSHKNLGFIQRPEDSGVKGFFDNALEDPANDGLTRIKVLENAAQNFPVEEAFTSRKSLENSPYFRLIQLGKSMLGNLEISSEDIAKATLELDVLTAGLGMLTDVKKTLWDNFIYQVVTQKDFYVKEAIVEILKAIHYLETILLTETETDELKKVNGEDLLAKARLAVVALPESLFMDDAPQEEYNKVFTVDETKIGKGRIRYADESKISRKVLNRLEKIANQESEIAEALITKNDLQNLKEELLAEQKDYSKRYGKSYTEEYDAYMQRVQPIIDENERLVKALESTMFTELSENDKKVAYNNLELEDIPPFEFTFQKEIDFTRLSTNLSETSFAILLELATEFQDSSKRKLLRQARLHQQQATDNTVVDSEKPFKIISAEELDTEEGLLVLKEEYNTFASLLPKLEEEINAQQKKVLSCRKPSPKEYTNIGGVLIPVKNRTAVTQNNYFLTVHARTFFSTRSYINFGFEVEDESWAVESANLQAVTDVGELAETLTDIEVIDNKVVFPVVLAELFRTVDSLRIEIWFTNGCSSVLELKNVSGTSYGVLPILKLQHKDGAQQDTPFQPKHFGVRRLGIADYLKVEQSVHAYVPGEVSNIENVMASELRHKSVSETQRSETITDTIKSQEVEKLSDTTKTDRSEMQTEVAKEIDRQQSWEASTRASGKAWGWSLEVGASYANSTAQHESTRQAVAKSQEITERALERVVTKISEERIQKIFKEVTLQNVHEFDNRGKAASTGSPLPAPPQHITGVYRWVDKKMKNQIYNYGKRLMFEFMIPEPARLHRLATQAGGVNLKSPIDPRSQEAGNWHMTSDNITEELLKHWANEYDVKLTEMITKSITHHIDETEYYLDSVSTPRFQTLDIPKNYAIKSATVYFRYEWGYMKMSKFKKDEFFYFPDLNWDTKSFEFTIDKLNIEDKYLYEFQGTYVNKFWVTFNLMCEPSDTYLTTWRQENFNAIIAAYTAAKEKFDADVKAAKEAAAAAAADKKEKLTNFYREIESNLLKQNCIAYLLQDYLNILGTGFDKGGKIEDFQILLGDDLDRYTSLAKFMEQAFEWTVMDYTFYPYYWANRSHWQEMYLTEETDPLFRNFLQAGMARVIVTVKPGFEDAVQFFMTTGKIWNGGEVPVIGDPMYLSIVDELREPQGKPQGNYWITRVPTTLTILQAGSAGLEVTNALPIFPEKDPENCENPAELETVSAFGKPVDAVMQSTPGTGSTIPTEITNVIVRK